MKKAFLFAGAVGVAYLASKKFRGQSIGTGLTSGNRVKRFFGPRNIYRLSFLNNLF